MTDLYLIRHAEAEGNVFRRLQGQYDSMITANGMRQIAALAARFRDIPVDAVYSSDLTRTCTTAGALCAPKGLPLHRERRLREIGCGVWENTPFAEFARRDPKSSYDFSHHPTTWRAEGSEPFAVYTGRFLQALREIAERHAGQTVALFSHGMVLRGSLQTLFFPEDENAVQHCENTAVTHVIYENGAFRLDYLNDDSHITPEISTVGRQKWWRGGDHNDFNMWYRDAAPGTQSCCTRLRSVPAVGACASRCCTRRPSARRPLTGRTVCCTIWRSCRNGADAVCRRSCSAKPSASAARPVPARCASTVSRRIRRRAPCSRPTALPAGRAFWICSPRSSGRSYKKWEAASEPYGKLRRGFFMPNGARHAAAVPSAPCSFRESVDATPCADRPASHPQGEKQPIVKIFAEILFIV